MSFPDAGKFTDCRLRCPYGIIDLYSVSISYKYLRKGRRNEQIKEIREEKDPDAAPNAQVGRVYEAIHAFVKEAPQFDDITMLCIQYKGSDACEENRIQMQKTAALSAVRSGLSDRAGCHGEL